MITRSIIPPSPAERLIAYYTARARVGGFHPADIAARASRGLAILRRIAWLEQHKRNRDRAIPAHRHQAGGLHLITSRAAVPWHCASTLTKEQK